MINIAVLVSGGGTNLQALIDAQQAGKIENGRIAFVVSSNPDAFALERAAKAGIPSAVLRRREFASPDAYGAALDALLREREIGLVVLAGFMTVLSADFCRRYENRIINIHPSLIPAFCGEGFYGLRVHEAALAKGVKVTGATDVYKRQGKTHEKPYRLSVDDQLPPAADPQAERDEPPAERGGAVF